MVAGRVSINVHANTLQAASGNVVQLNTIFAKYSPTVADPELVSAVAKWAGRKVVEVDAGGGYWSYLLAQYGKEVTAYDLHPRGLWWPVEQLDRTRSVLSPHDDCTLISMGDRYPFNAFVRSLQRFNGLRCILSADGDPFRTNALREILERGWDLAEGPLSGLQRQREARAVYVFDRRLPGSWNGATRVMPEIKDRGHK